MIIILKKNNNNYRPYCDTLPILVYSGAQTELISREKLIASLKKLLSEAV